MKKEMRKIKGKKAVGSHIEIIMSFVLFFGFVVFLLIFMRPTKQSTLPGSVVSGLHDSFRQKVYTNLTEVFLKTEHFGGSCFFVNLREDLFTYDFSNSLVNVAGGGNVDSKLEPGGGLQVMAGEGSYEVMFSPEFVDEDVSCSSGSGSDGVGFLLGGIGEKQLVSNKELLKMKQKYEEGYEDLKNDLNFPSAFDFAIVSDVVVVQRVIPEQAEVKARDYVEEVLFEDGTIKNVRFTFKVW